MREGDKHTLALQLGRIYARTRALGSISDPGSPASFSDRPTDSVVKGAPARGVSRVSLRGMSRRVSFGRCAVGKSWGGCHLCFPISSTTVGHLATKSLPLPLIQLSVREDIPLEVNTRSRCCQVRLLYRWVRKPS